MKKILWGLVYAAALLFLTHGTAEAQRGSIVWPTSASTITGTSNAAAVVSLGTIRTVDATDSTGAAEYRYVRFWGRDSVQVGEVCYDTTGVSPWNVTNVSPAAVNVDTLGITDSTTATNIFRNCVAGICTATQTYGSYGWLQTGGYCMVRMAVPKQKAVAAGATGGYVGRKYTAGLPICGSAAGVARVATVPALLSTGKFTGTGGAITTANMTSLIGELAQAYAIFGHVAITATQDTTGVYCYIRCKN